MTNLEQIKQKKASNCFVINGYSPKLNFVIGNRNTINPHINNIYKSMFQKDEMPPIIVNESDLSIIDGQHRYLAAQRIWENGNKDYELIVIIMKFNNSFYSAMEFNSKSRKWSLNDYVLGLRAIGNESCIRLYDFCNSNPEFINKLNKFQYTAAIELILGGRCSELVKSNKLIISKEDIVNANKLLSQLRHIRHLLSIKYGSNDCRLDFLFKRNNIKGYYDFVNYIKKNSNLTFENISLKISENFIFPIKNTASDYYKAYLNSVINK